MKLIVKDGKMLIYDPNSGGSFKISSQVYRKMYNKKRKKENNYGKRN